MDNTILALLMVLCVGAFALGVHAYLTNKERRERQAKSAGGAKPTP